MAALQRIQHEGVTDKALLAQVGMIKKKNFPESWTPAVQEVGRCRFKPVEARVASAWFQRLTLHHDELLSRLAYRFNLRPTRRRSGTSSCSCRASDDVDSMMTRVAIAPITSSTRVKT